MGSARKAFTISCGPQSNDDLLKDPLQRRLEQRFAELQQRYDFMARDPKKLQEKAMKQLEQLRNLPPTPSRSGTDGEDADGHEDENKDGEPNRSSCIEDGPSGLGFYVGYTNLELRKLYDIHQSIEGELLEIQEETITTPEVTGGGFPSFDGIQAAVQKHLEETKQNGSASLDQDTDPRGGGFPQ